MNKDDIFLTSIREINKGTVRYVCDAFIRPKNITIQGCLLLQKGENRWVNFPSDKWEENGEQKFKERVIFHDPIEAAMVKKFIKLALDEEKSGPTEKEKDEIENLPF